MKQNSLMEMLLEPQDYLMKDLQCVVYQSMLKDELQKEIAKVDKLSIFE